MSATAAPSQDISITKPDSHPSRVQKTKATLQYLYDPKTAHQQPAHLHTRTFLRSLRYVFIFAFWRLVRYAKYAIVGAAVAAVSGTVIGSVASGAAFLIAPTGILGGAGVGLLWAVAKFGFRRAKKRMQRQDGDGDPRRDERDDAEDGQRRAKEEARRVRGLKIDPW